MTMSVSSSYLNPSSEQKINLAMKWSTDTDPLVLHAGEENWGLRHNSQGVVQQKHAEPD